MILIDTAPLVALCDPRESRHEQSALELERLLPAGLGTCDAVLAEACFHLPRPAQRARLRAVVDEFLVETLPTHTAQFRSEVFDWLSKYQDHEPDWADGCIAVLCGHNRKLKIWTHDREFLTVWRRPDGKPLPLAVE